MKIKSFVSSSCSPQVLCPYDQGKYLGPEIKVFEADYAAYPQWGKAHCGRVVGNVGELLYYPAYWWHTTKCLDSPTIG